MKNKTLLSLAFGVYLATSVLSYVAFAQFGVGTTSSEVLDESPDETALGSLLQINPSEPKDQPCPLNGQMYTQTEKDAWEKRRPLAVMIENAPDARPQSGMSDSDVVFEAVAEGGVTRFMAFFYCGVQKYDTTLAPIRSARSYFIDWASGFNYPMYVHVGGANIPGPTNALGQLGDYGWNLQNDMNQFSIGYTTFVRNANRLGRQVATEHTMETTTEKLWEVAADRDWTNMAPARRIAGKAVAATDWKDGYTGWTFQDEAPADGSVTTVAYDFWSGYNDYSVKWEYDPATKAYKRTMGGKAHLDLNNDEQIMASNVVVILTEEKGPLNEAKHMLYRTTGAGKVLIFKNGQAIEGRWTKQNREAELQFVNTKGDVIELARGLTWISVVDDSTKVEY